MHSLDETTIKDFRDEIHGVPVRFMEGTFFEIFQLQQQQQFQQIPQLSGVAPWVETKVGIISIGRNLPVMAILCLKCNYLWWKWPAAELGYTLV